MRAQYKHVNKYTVHYLLVYVASRSLADVLWNYARHTDTESLKQCTNLQVFTPAGI